MALSGATTLGQSGPWAMAVEGCSAFPKVLALLEPHHQIVFRTLIAGGYPSAVVKLVYSTAPAVWAKMKLKAVIYISVCAQVWREQISAQFDFFAPRCESGRTPLSITLNHIEYLLYQVSLKRISTVGIFYVAIFVLFLWMTPPFFFSC